MAKKSKEIRAPSGLSSTAKRLISLLKKAAAVNGSTGNSELLYELEKYSRELANDEDKNVTAYHFKRAVDNLYNLAHVQHNQVQELNLCLSSGQTYSILGLLDEARNSYDKAITLSSELDEKVLKARALRLLGNLHLQQTELKAAISHFEKSIDLCQESGEPLEEAYGLNSLCAAYFQMAAWRKMERACDQGLIIAERLGEDELIACIYNNLGAMHSIRGQWQKALAAFQKCLPLFEMAGDYRGLAETYNNMATLYRDQDMWHEAGKCYAQSIRFSNQAGDTLAKANALL
ncbi:MAG: tetratricopeptide repeat protein, partial [bacterium]